MTFEEFEGKNIVREKGFSFEVENDYHEWWLSLTEIFYMKLVRNY